MGSGCKVKLVGKVRYLPAGGSEVLRQPGVVSLLRQQAESAAARCNSMAHLGHASTAPAYEAVQKGVRYFDGYVVRTANAEAAIDNRVHNTLKKGCNV